MHASSSKRECSHRFVDQYSGKCLHCGQQNSASVLNKTKVEVYFPDQDESLETEHYERLVLMLENWKKNTINRIESIYKSKLERLRDNFESQQLTRRRLNRIDSNKNAATNDDDDDEQIRISLSSNNFRLIHSVNLDTEYTHMATSTNDILVHDGRVFKLFNKDLRPLVALDLIQSIRERSRVVDLCYSSYLSSYLILFEQSLWLFKPGSNAILVPSMKRNGYLSLTTNNKDVFVLDREGTIEQRSLVSWTYLRRYSRQNLLNDYLTDQLISIRFHSIDLNMMMAIVRTMNNRRCVMIYQHYGSNTFKFFDRVIFPNINIFMIDSLSISQVWLLTTCEKKSFFFLSHKRQYHQRQQQQLCFALDCDYRIKNIVFFQIEPRSIVLRSVRPSQLRLYHF